MRGDLRRARRFAAVSALAGVGLGVPLFLDPYRWARGFGWPREPETDVGLYFGRCLGALATATCVQAARAARDPERHRSYFEFVEIGGGVPAARSLPGLFGGGGTPAENPEK